MSSLEDLLCYVDDFYRVFEPKLSKKRLSADSKARKRHKILTLVEIITNCRLKRREPKNRDGLGSEYLGEVLFVPDAEPRFWWFYWW